MCREEINEHDFNLHLHRSSLPTLSMPSLWDVNGGLAPVVTSAAKTLSWYNPPQRQTCKIPTNRPAAQRPCHALTVVIKLNLHNVTHVWKLIFKARSLQLLLIIVPLRKSTGNELTPLRSGLLKNNNEKRKLNSFL